MQVVIKKWGNSVGIRIPSSILTALNMQVEAIVDIREEAGKIIIEPVRQTKYSLENLLTAITTDNLHQEISTGTPVGKEAL